MVHLRTGVGGMGRASASQTLKGSDDGGGAEGVLVGTVVIGGQQTGTAHRNSTAKVHTGSAQWLCAPVQWHRKCITEVRPGCARRKCTPEVHSELSGDPGQCGVGGRQGPGAALSAEAFV